MRTEMPDQPGAKPEPIPHAGKKRRTRKKPARECGARTRKCDCRHHRNEHAGKAGKCSGPDCDCRAFVPRPCTATQLIKPSMRCRMHGGKAHGGPLLAPAWRHGRWSKYLPEGLGDKFLEALEDPTLMQLDKDMALADALLTTLTKQMKSGKSVSVAMEKRIAGLLDTRRRMSESHARRERDLAVMVPFQMFRAFALTCMALFREHVNDPAALQSIQQRLRLLAPKANDDVVAVRDGDDDEA